MALNLPPIFEDFESIIKNLQYHIPKMKGGGGGQRSFGFAFSENSSVLVGWPVPKGILSHGLALCDPSIGKVVLHTLIVCTNTHLVPLCPALAYSGYRN